MHLEARVDACVRGGCVSLCNAVRARICVRKREGGGGLSAHRRRLWILHSMRIKATASPKVINLPAALTTTLLLLFHISLTQSLLLVQFITQQSPRLCYTNSQISPILWREIKKKSCKELQNHAAELCTFKGKSPRITTSVTILAPFHVKRYAAGKSD